MFDANDFLNSTIAESNDTVLLNPPDNMSGEGYMIIADKVACRAWQGKADPSKSGLVLDITWLIEDEGVKEFCGREKVQCRQSVMLDLNESGGLDLGKGKNIGLGKLREALGMNVSGQPFSFGMIQGRIAKGFVQHRVEGDNIYAEIKRVGKM